MSLQTLKDSPSGVDLGPLQPNILPEMLRTEGDRIHLLHPLLEADINRLRESLSEETPEMVLIGRRHIRDMNSWLHNLHNYARGKNRCTLMINPEDARSRGLSDGGEAKISSAVGELVVPVEFQVYTGQEPQLWFCVALMILGFGVVFPLAVVRCMFLLWYVACSCRGTWHVLVMVRYVFLPWYVACS